MSRRIRLALTGECMVELVPDPGRKDMLRRSFSGDTLNTAVYVSRLGGVETSYLSSVGTDSLSDAMLRFWQQEGIDASLTRRLPGAVPGLYMIQTDENGERSFLYWRSASAARLCYSGRDADGILDALASFDGVYLSGISLAVFFEDGRTRLLERLAQLAGKVPVFFDANFRPSLWGGSRDEAVERARPWYRNILPLCSMLFLSPEEAEAFDDMKGCAGPEDTAVRLASRMRPGAELIMKDGSRPCLLWDAKRMLRVPPLPVENVVDTTAAGDSFAAAYLHARLHGMSPEQAARRGHRLAAAVIREPGAVIPVNHMPEELIHESF